MSRYLTLNLRHFHPSVKAGRRFLSQQTHYTVLKIKPDASDKDIRTAFILLSKLYHPDLSKDGVGSHDKFIKIKTAYDVLSNKQKREDYDRQLNRHQYHSPRNYQNYNHNWQDYEQYKYDPRQYYYQNKERSSQDNNKRNSEVNFLLGFSAFYIVFIILLVGFFIIRGQGHAWKFNNTLKGILRKEPGTRTDLENQILQEYSKASKK